ncbi:hypothetical protein ACQ4M4_27360 [Leptolyngbya sp. AN02str]|uniref:hypothetical protein n=1 Tax=Leptolyngbya sp. AN02str TaxID=3423363 RepID=UPI003D3122E2
MKNVLRCAIALIIALAPTAAQAQFRPEVQSQCEEALRSAGSLLLRERNLTVVDAGFWRASEIYRGYPDNKPVAFGVRLSGPDAENVMNSIQLMTTISRTIINGCPPVGLVTFSMAETDWQSPFGLINGQVREFECVDPSSEPTTPWGYYTCI